MCSLQGETRYSSETERYGLLKQRAAIGTEYFTLLVGGQYRSSNLIIQSPVGSHLRMPDEERNESKWFVDVKSKDFHFGEVWGSFLLVQSFNFELQKQTVQSSFLDTFRSGNTVYGSNRQVQNLGTEVTGHITNIMPVFYVGDREKEFFRIGFGFGPSLVKMKGNPDFFNGNSEEAPLLALQGAGTTQEKIDRFGDLALLRNGKPETDPINVYLLSRLSEGNNLELFGLYQYSKGNLDLGRLNGFTYYLLSQNSEANLTPLQIVSLMNVARSDLKLKEKYVSSFYLFFEIPFYDVTFRFGYGGPLYYQENYRVRFHNIDLSLYIPIDF
ncbi:hypothetical protein LPTSP4_19520 [Leptospira ryugenii]|uniref:Uncharacterized protein n=1 Tax=Leptospira ryugenii TaxID=1917863 RepID=A0A2P2E0L4_9LEPT|nr:hypothetical protein [Leptospira ryugenii]GBF50427.1 hypothetical protein LPTSP4_19520 [Leptospira ryugenii]